MAMSKKNYEALAEVMRDSRELFASNLAHAEFAKVLAASCLEDNSLFDTKRFIMACMPRAWVGTSKANHWERIANYV